MKTITQEDLDTAAARAPAASQDWCGHTGRYLVRVFLCGGRGQSDRLMACDTCGQEYLASYLAQVRPPSSQEAKRRRVPLGSATAAPRDADEPGHTMKERHMGVPSSRTGNPKPRQQAQAKETQRKDLGEGSVSGNLTRDPELRYTPAGRALASMRIAHTPRSKNPGTGEWENGETAFYDVTAWGPLSENCAEHLRKGDRIIAEGNWVEETWEDREGNERTTVKLTARDLGPSMLFLGATIRRTKRSKGE